MSIFDFFAYKTKFMGLLAGCGVLLGLPISGLAQTLRHVTDAGDTGLATQLRAVIAASASGDTVDFAGLAMPATITLTGGVITISSKNLTIIGPGAKLVTLSGNHTTGTTGSRIFYVASSWLTVSGLTFTGGYADAHSSPMDFGGAIEISNAATVEDAFSDCEFVNNVAFIGGALDVYGGELSLQRCTFSGNMVNYDTVHRYGAQGGALSYGGGLWGTQNIVNCTFANNTQNSAAAGEGGAVYDYGHSTATLMTCCTFVGNTDQTGKAAALVADGTAGTPSVSLQDCVFAGNNNGSGAQVNYFQDNLTSSHALITSTGGNVCDATARNNGQNIIGILMASDSFTNSALAGSLGALANNGGQVQTVALSPGSVAIGRGVASANVPATDARGAARRTPPDAGAFETLPPLSIAASTLADGTQAEPGYSQAVTATGGDGGYAYAVTAGSLPAGLTLGSATGLIYGTPTGAGSSFAITVTDAIGLTATQTFSIAIDPGSVPPPLNIGQAGNVAAVYWQNVSGWNLQQSPDLTISTNWVYNTTAILSAGTNYLMLTNPPASMFYRLHP